VRNSYSDDKSKNSPEPFIGDEITANAHICGILEFQDTQIKTYLETIAAAGANASVFNDSGKGTPQVLLSTSPF
jgi:hypothetical protein